VRAGVLDDVLVARRRIPPLILVMPFGSTGTFTDKEWVNGIRPNERWETFLARDVVGAIDRRYRTIQSGAGRAIGGLSEGGYGAINVALHHPGEFHVVESWSGYERADPLRSIFGADTRRLAFNTPLLQLRRVARALRRAHAFFWFYSGRDDRYRFQNRAFARLLARERIPHRYFEPTGGHNWALWRGEAASALVAAGRHLPSGTVGRRGLARSP
jgi:enterochelin esterase-like enzyme